jgi:hypothetical protein
MDALTPISARAPGLLVKYLTEIIFPTDPGG